MDIRGGTAILDDGCIKDRHISNNLLDIIDASKVKPFARPDSSFGFKNGDALTTVQVSRYVAEGGETVLGFHTLLTSGASTNISFDLLKNGSSILSAALVYNTAGTRTVQNATIASPTLAVNDVLEFLMTVTVATGASNPFAWANIKKASLPS